MLAPYKADGVFYRLKGPDTAIWGLDAAMRGVGQAPAPYKTDGASYRLKVPDLVTRSKG